MKKQILLIVIILCGLQSIAQSNYTTRVIKNGLFIPWEIIYAPDDHIWFTQKNGYICRLDPLNGNLDTLYHESNTAIKGEGGMLGMALHPSFPGTPAVFVAYQYNQGNNYLCRIVKYDYNGSVLTNPQILIDNIPGSTIHNGCRLLIINNQLYISTGDAANPASAQNINAVSGKILRINLDGSIPTDNPVAGSAVWNWGQRNVQGLVYAHNKLYSSMHGNTTDDEINILEKGKNYGWPNVEGYCNTSAEISFCNDSNVVEPIYAWTPTIAPSGIDFYDHPMFPALQGSLLMATLKDQRLYQLQLDANYEHILSTRVITEVNYGRLRDICISPEGRIFISTNKSNSDGTGSHIDQIIELYDSTFTGVSSNLKDEFRIYPNPAGNELFIPMYGQAGQDWQYSIDDLTGRNIQKGTIRLPSTMDISTLENGAYIIRLSNGNGELISKRVIRE